jgi:glycosyltransferase involved in cell wall biosynthesis
MSGSAPPSGHPQGPSVLQLAASAAWGGAEQVADTLRAEAERAGWRARLELPFTPGERWRDATPRDIAWWPWALRRREPVDVVHAHLPWPDRLGAALVAARGRPLVVTFQLLPMAGGWPRDRCFALPAARVLRAAGRWRKRVRWVALSRADAKTLGAMLDAPVTVVRNAPPAPPPSTERLDWPAGQMRVLSVGRLETQKGFDRMLRALAAPEVKALAWHWNVIGEGSERAALTALVRSLGLEGRVSLVGARPGVDGLRDAELLLAPSRFEGMPLVPLEAAEAGVPVVASTIDPHEELYERVPETLLPRDEREWPAALARWLGEGAHRRRVGEAQRAVIGADPRGKWFADYEALYRAVMAER